MLSVMFLKPRAFAAAVIGAVSLSLDAVAQPYEARHGGGEMAMSADGRIAAFTVEGLSANQFVLFDTANKSAIIIETPGPHVGDLGWSPDGDELTFVTSKGQTLSGAGRHVWRLRRTAGDPVVELLALIPYVRSPVLSADGTSLASFEGVIAGDGPSNKSNIAYAIFERTIEDGRSTRRSEGHTQLGGNLKYDRSGALFVQLNMPVFPYATKYSGGVWYKWDSRDAAGRWDYQWSSDIRYVYCFHLAPGETLPAWPSPIQVVGMPRGAHLVRPLDDGRVAMYVSFTPYSLRDWYDENGQARPRPSSGPPPYDYVAYAPDGTAEILVRTPLPEGAGRSGGADLSADGALFAQVIAKRPEDRAHHTLMVFKHGALAFETPVTELVAQARHIKVAPSEVPLMLAVSEPHRLAVDPVP